LPRLLQNTLWEEFVGKDEKEVMTTYSLFPKYMRTKFRKKIGMFAKGLKKNIKISRLAPPKVA